MGEQLLVNRGVKKSWNAGENAGAFTGSRETSA